MKVLLVWLLTCLIWGTVWLFIKIGLRDLPPLSFAGLRLALALAILLPLLAARRTPLPRTRREWSLVLFTGFLLLGANYALLYWGARHIPSGLTALLQAATPAFGLLFAQRLLPGERATRSAVASLALGLAGVAVVFSDQLRVAGWPALAGSAAVAAGAACVALAYVVIKSAGTRLHPTSLMAGQMLCGMIPLVAAGLLREGNPADFNWTPAAVGSLLYLTLAGSLAGFWLNYWLLRRMDAMKVLLMSIPEPLLAVLLGALVLGERLTRETAAGGVLILASVWLALRRPAASSRAGDDASDKP
jgi:drug/metabolite transporter (DMT)-like permease